MFAPRRSDPRRWLHAERLVARGRPGRFWIRLAPCNPRHAFVELWLPGGPGTPALSQYQAVVTAPGGAASAALGAGEALTLSRDGRALAALVFARRVAQGEHGTMLLLAVGPTGGRHADAGACAPAGVWCVALRSQATAEARVHAWVERDDAIEPPRRPQQTFFERDPDDDPATPSVNDACTLSSLAHGARVVVAAGLVASDGCAVDDASRAQRRLPDGRLAPVAQQLAPSERGYTLSGVAVPGFHSGMHATLNGSSAAVPQVARRLAAQADGSAAASAGSAATVRP